MKLAIYSCKLTKQVVVLLCFTGNRCPPPMNSRNSAQHLGMDMCAVVKKMVYGVIPWNWVISTLIGPYQPINDHPLLTEDTFDNHPSPKTAPHLAVF